MQSGFKSVNLAQVFVAFTTPMRGVPVVIIANITFPNGTIVTDVTSQVVWSNYLGFKVSDGKQSPLLPMIMAS